MTDREPTEPQDSNQEKTTILWKKPEAIETERESLATAEWKAGRQKVLEERAIVSGASYENGVLKFTPEQMELLQKYRDAEKQWEMESSENKGRKKFSENAVSTILYAEKRMSTQIATQYLVPELVLGKKYSLPEDFRKTIVDMRNELEVELKEFTGFDPSQLEANYDFPKEEEAYAEKLFEQCSNAKLWVLDRIDVFIRTDGSNYGIKPNFVGATAFGNIVSEIARELHTINQEVLSLIPEEETDNDKTERLRQELKS